jgi:NADPH:quinone reductase
VIAAAYVQLGPSSVLELTEVERPQPGPGEVRVRLTVSGVNPTDWKSRSGGGIATPSPPPEPQIPNQDGAGVVDAIGEGVTSPQVGQRVWVYFASWKRRWGTAAQWTLVPANQAVPLPDEASDELGASLGIPALTAHRCLFADGPLDGKTVLVAGGAGAVGHSAIELARWAGARVVATASSDEKARLAREAGAESVVRYREPDALDRIAEVLPNGADRIVEVALGPNVDLDMAAVAPNAVVTTYADPGEGSAGIPVSRLMARNIALRFVLVYTMPEDALRAAVAGVSAALADGALSTLPLHRFPLSEIAAAHDAVQAGAVGKVVVDIPA